MNEYWDILDQHGNPTGRTHQRGLPMKAGEYHRGVTVWIINTQGECLISQRTATRPIAPLMWEATTGGVLAGEDSLTAALRETEEELGIQLNPCDGTIYSTYTYPHSSDPGSVIFDVWVFRHDVELDDITLQVEETCDVKWASPQHMLEMVEAGEMTPYTFLDEFLDYVQYEWSNM